MSHVSSTENVSPSHKITARSMTFWSSRMFPGQSYAWNSVSADLLIFRMRLPAFVAYRSIRYSTRSGMSSARSRRDGTWIGKTLSR